MASPKTFRVGPVPIRAKMEWEGRMRFARLKRNVTYKVIPDKDYPKGIGPADNFGFSMSESLYNFVVGDKAVEPPRAEPPPKPKLKLSSKPEPDAPDDEETLKTK